MNEEVSWHVGEKIPASLENAYLRLFKINTKTYVLSEDAAAICHSILLLRESFNELNFL